MKTDEKDLNLLNERIDELIDMKSKVDEFIKCEIIRLRKLLIGYNIAYYRYSKSLVTDYEYDMLMKSLERLEEKCPYFKSDKSPTVNVGSSLMSIEELREYDGM